MNWAIDDERITGFASTRSEISTIALASNVLIQINGKLCAEPCNSRRSRSYDGECEESTDDCNLSSSLHIKSPKSNHK